MSQAVMLSEVSQITKGKYCMMSLECSPQRNQQKQKIEQWLLQNSANVINFT
jgi:hypothetical protein